MFHTLKVGMDRLIFYMNILRERENKMFYPNKEEFKTKAKEYNLIPVYTEILADMETPVSAFLKIDNNKNSFLLESVEGGENLGRYSFLGTNPSLIFKSKDKEITITKENETKTFTTDSDPLYEMENLIKDYKPAPMEKLPKFFGGMVGYIGYDNIRFFEDIPDTNEDNLNQPDCCFMLTDTIIIFDHVNRTIKIVANTHPSSDLDADYETACEKIKAIVEQLKKPLENNILSTNQVVEDFEIKSNETKKSFCKKVETAKEYIRAGDIFQVVLSQRFEDELKTESFNLYRVLRALNPSPYMYFIRNNDFKIVGSSPEILVQCEDNKVRVRPIAGTRPRGKDHQEDVALEKDLLADEKEISEHVMLVDLGRNDIGRISHTGTVKVSDMMTIERYSHVMHIVTNVSGMLKADKTIFDAIRATFPAGTLSGAPKVRAMEIIEELEIAKRGVYGGAVGYFSFSGNMDFAIAIRTAFINGKKAYLQAGAGIVADSVPENEYQECLNKAGAVIKAIKIANQNI